MTRQETQMRREILQIPEAVDRLLTDGARNMQSAGEALRALDPRLIVTVARGSSDHAATYFKYATELLTGVPVASVGPSVASVYKRPLKLSGAACVSISQSGKSPDIVEMARMARSGGALSLAVTNDGNSPLAQVSDHTLDLHAGPELSVAATKTFVTSVVSTLWLLAEWTSERELRAAIAGLPKALDEAVQLDWPEVREALDDRNSLYCLGRGPAFAISNEAALKFKETCQIHAESYSSAEVLHGPVSIVDQGFPIIALAAGDAAEPAITQVADQVNQKGALAFVTSEMAQNARPLPSIRTGHPLADPITLIASFYAMVEKVAAARGINPDAPRHLRKVTETV